MCPAPTEPNETATACISTSPPGPGCGDFYGDLDANAHVNVVDLQCVILTTLWWTSSDDDAVDFPTCLAGSPEDGDLNCDQEVTVTDVVLSVYFVLNEPLTGGLDDNGNQCPDSCDP